MADQTLLTGVEQGLPRKYKDISGAGTAYAPAVTPVDASGNVLASGGTQYTDGAATAAHPIGGMPVFDNGGTVAHVGAGAGQGLPAQVRDAVLAPLAGFQQLTLSGTAAALTVPAGATIAVINIEQGACRYRDDGTAATAAVGALYPAGSTLSVTITPLSNVSLARDAGSTAAQANVSYYQ